MRRARTQIRFLALLLSAGIAATACGAWGDVPAAGEPAREGPEAVPVEVEAVQRRTLERVVRWSGTLEPELQVAVAAEIAGEVAEVAVQVGDRVRRGDRLIRLEGEALRRQVEQAEAGLASARAGLSEAEQAYQAALREWERMDALYAEGAVSRQQWEQAQDQLQRAKLVWEQQAPAQVRQAEAALAAARQQRDLTLITAPVSGEVAAVMVSRGDYAGPGTPLIQLVDRSTMKLAAELSERQVVDLEVGMPARVWVSVLGDAVFTGRVAQVAPAASASGGFPVEVVLPEPDPRLRAGYHAEVEIPVERKADVPAVPVEALEPSGDVHTAFVVEEGIARRRTVRIGLNDGVYAEILEGLREGDQVVVAGRAYLSEGVPVRIRDRSPIPAEGDGDGADDEGSGDESDDERADDDEGADGGEAPGA